MIFRKLQSEPYHKSLSEIGDMTLYNLNSLLCEEDELSGKVTFSSSSAASAKSMAETYRQESVQRDDEVIERIIRGCQTR